MRSSLRDLVRTAPALKRVGAAWFLVNLAEWAYVTVLLIDGYREHGALAAALVAARFIAGALLGPLLLGLLIGRRPPAILRALSFARAAVVAAVAVALATHAPLAVLVAIVWTDAVLAAPYRPVQAALLPALATTPQELSTIAGSVPASKALAQALGALGGSLALSVVAGDRVVAVSAVILALSAALIGRLREAASAVALPAPRADRGGIRFGFSMAGRHAGALLLLGGARALTRGVWTALTVVASIELLHLGSAGVGLLMAAAGVGAAIAIPLSLVFAGRERLAGPGALAFAASGAAIALVGIIARSVPAVALIAVWGVALSLADSISNSAIHRVVDARVLAPSVAALESSKLLLEGIGALVAPVLLALVGIRDALIIAGLPLLLLVGTTRGGLRAIDLRAARRARPLAALRRAPSFHGMTMLAFESLAARLQPTSVAAGTVIVRQGEQGDRFYLIDSGSVEVTINGFRVAVLRAGGSFGERALLRGAPRSATVRALEDTSLWHLDGSDFIAAATGNEGPSAQRRWVAHSRTVGEAIAQTALFGAVDQHELAARGHEISCPAGQEIVREGEPGTCFYLLLEGAAAVTIAGRRVAGLQAGDCFGEIALLHDVPRTATVTATVATRLWELDRAAFLEAVAAGEGDGADRADGSGEDTETDRAAGILI